MITHKAVTEMRYEALKEIKILSQKSLAPFHVEIEFPSSYYKGADVINKF